MIFGTKGGDNIKNIFQRICEKLTRHRWRKGNAYSVGIEPTEYYYQCQICRYRFWRFKPFKGAPPQPNGYDPYAIDKMMKEMKSLSISKTLSDSEWAKVVDSINNVAEGYPLVSFEEVSDLVERQYNTESRGQNNVVV